MYDYSFTPLSFINKKFAHRIQLLTKVRENERQISFNALQSLQKILLFLFHPKIETDRFYD